MAELRNPGLTGDVAFDTVIYAAPGVNYSSVPALAQYTLYDTPDPAYVTGRIDISLFANLGSAPWPFSNANVPLNGHICVPVSLVSIPRDHCCHHRRELSEWLQLWRERCSGYRSS